jgi:hypothetical protein
MAEKVRKMKGMTIDAEKIGKEEKKKAKKTLEAIFKDNKTGR